MKASDLSVGVFSSLCLHILLGVFGLGAILASWENSRIVPEFKHGLSSIELNLVSVSIPEPVLEVVPAEPEVVSAEVPVDPIKQPEEIPVEALVDEGEEQGDPKVTTDIKPSYPIGSRMRGEEGSATIRVWIDAAGRAARNSA